MPLLTPLELEELRSFLMRNRPLHNTGRMSMDWQQRHDLSRAIDELIERRTLETKEPSVNIELIEEER